MENIKKTIKKINQDRKVKKSGNRTVVDTRDRLEIDVEEIQSKRDALAKTTEQLEELTAKFKAMLESGDSESENDFNFKPHDESFNKSDIMSRMSTRSQQMMQLGVLEEVEVDVNDFAAVDTLSEANRTNSVHSQPVTPIASNKSPVNSIKPSPRPSPHAQA